jgi:hypothetical protein
MVGRPVRLEPHQKERIENVFGWKRKDNPDPELCSRQYRTLYLEEPRGNGKSTEAACIVLVMLFQDREAGGQIYSAATEMDQARIIFNIAKEMILLDEGMSGKVEILKDSIYFPQWGTAYKPIPASHQSKHGLNAAYRRAANIDGETSATPGNLHDHSGSRPVIDLLGIAPAGPEGDCRRARGRRLPAVCVRGNPEGRLEKREDLD